jgi:hypothetical protein
MTVHARAGEPALALSAPGAPSGLSR